MSKPVFIWYPDEEFNRKVKDDVNITKFGEGYELRAKKGLNSQSEEWSLTFTVNLANAPDIRNFLEARGETESFLWTTPNNVQKTFVRRGEFDESRKGTALVIFSVKFGQVFEQ